MGRRASPGPRGRMRRRLSSLAGPALRGALAARRPGDAPRVVISSRSRSVASVASGSDASARDDDVPPLAYEMVEPPPGTPGASDAPIALVLHGLLGSGRNWRTFTRALSRACAEAGAPWRFALCDLIYHGKTHAERAHRASRNPALRADARDDDDAPDPLDLAADAVDRLAAHLRRRPRAASSDADADADAASAPASDSRPPPPSPPSSATPSAARSRSVTSTARTPRERSSARSEAAVVRLLTTRRCVRPRRVPSKSLRILLLGDGWRSGGRWTRRRAASRPARIRTASRSSSTRWRRFRGGSRAARNSGSAWSEAGGRSRASS